jgi:P27 family predicted phage terminase small subunit
VVKDYDLDPHHQRVLQVACESWDRMQQAQEVLREEGIITRGSRGQLQPHPATIVEKDSRIAFLRALRELNLDAEQGPGVS